MSSSSSSSSLYDSYISVSGDARTELDELCPVGLYTMEGIYNGYPYYKSPYDMITVGTCWIFYGDTGYGNKWHFTDDLGGVTQIRWDSNSLIGTYNLISGRGNPIIGFNLYGYQVVEINGSNSKNQFIPLHTHISATESDRTFWGCVYTPGELTNLAESGYLSMVVNGEEYWMKIYTADAVICDCCSNLIGDWRSL